MNKINREKEKEIETRKKDEGVEKREKEVEQTTMR